MFDVTPRPSNSRRGVPVAASYPSSANPRWKSASTVKTRDARGIQAIISIMNTTKTATRRIGTIAAFQSPACAFGAFSAARLRARPEEEQDGEHQNSGEDCFPKLHAQSGLRCAQCSQHPGRRPGRVRHAHAQSGPPMRSVQQLQAVDRAPELSRHEEPAPVPGDAVGDVDFTRARAPSRQSGRGRAIRSRRRSRGRCGPRDRIARCWHTPILRRTRARSGPR